MKLTHALALVAALALPLTAAHAERYGTLLPDASVDDVRSQFNGAVASDVLEAWMGPHDRLIRFTGAGIDGSVTVLFKDRLESNRALWLELLKAKSATPPRLWDKQAYLELVEDHVRKYSGTAGDVWEVVGARWTPAKALPLGEVEVRYGRDHDTTVDADLTRRVVWPGRRLAGVIGDNNTVETLEYGWTLDDRSCALDWRRGRECESQLRARNSTAVKKPLQTRSAPAQSAAR
ncbi:hypothetical protein BH10PSE17_BH10PSE17_10790 [soil metagenome]